MSWSPNIRISELSLENQTLRELVRELYETAYPEYPSMFEKLFLERIRELGIEVDV